MNEFQPPRQPDLPDEPDLGERGERLLDYVQTSAGPKVLVGGSGLMWSGFSLVARLFAAIVVEDTWSALELLYEGISTVFALLGSLCAVYSAGLGFLASGQRPDRITAALEVERYAWGLVAASLWLLLLQVAGAMMLALSGL